MLDERGRVKLTMIRYINWSFDPTYVYNSEHLELQQFARLGVRLTNHMREFEEELSTQIKGRIWGMRTSRDGNK